MAHQMSLNFACLIDSFKNGLKKNSSTNTNTTRHYLSTTSEKSKQCGRQFGQHLNFWKVGKRQEKITQKQGIEKEQKDRQIEEALTAEPQEQSEIKEFV